MPHQHRLPTPHQRQLPTPLLNQLTVPRKLKVAWKLSFKHTRVAIKNCKLWIVSVMVFTPKSCWLTCLLHVICIPRVISTIGLSLFPICFSSLRWMIYFPVPHNDFFSVVRISSSSTTSFRSIHRSPFHVNPVSSPNEIIYKDNRIQSIRLSIQNSNSALQVT